jgi:DNA helicase II / ATP-dependent DNA helicase PcrA
MSFLQQLNDVQRDAVQATDGPVMIVAGAGSGKTRVLTYRTAYLLQQGVRPDSVLALTFTNKAANEMKGRIAELVGPSSRAIWMGTFHSVFARILRVEAERIGFARSFSIYDTDDSQSLIKTIMNDLGISAQQFSPAGIRSRISVAKNSMISPAEFRKGAHDPMSQRTSEIFEEYVRRLAKNNAMDFDDLLLKPLDLFRRHRDVLHHYQLRFQYILVDEYQDTNRVQYQLLNELAARFKNICVVGDDAQSIYAFRGADIRNILDFEKDYPQCRVFRLEQNYRSTKTILGAADSLIKHNKRQIAKKLWTSNDDGDSIVLDICSDDREEARRIVAHIEEETLKRKLGLNDFAVLYRTNAQSRTIEDALRRAAVPYTIVGGVSFYKRKEIKDLIAYLRVIANPRDDESIARIINFPARAIGDTTIHKIRSVAAGKKVSLMDALAAPDLEGLLADRTLRAVRQFHGMLQKYIGLRSEVSVNELARALVDEIGVLRLLKEENTPESLARRENVQELISALAEFSDQHPGATLEDFLAEVSLISDVDTTDFGRNAVTLMTLHSAKGLEFPVVFISGLEEGLLPISLALDSNEEVEEERRLLYVGMTRAEKRLYLSFARTRYHQGEMLFSLRSRFVDEIDPVFVAPCERNGSPARLESGTRAMPSQSPKYMPRIPARTRPETEDSFTADPMPDYENHSQDDFQPRMGQRVVHETFGAGRIVALDGHGENARAIVEFESVGRKKLMLKFAKLRAG